MVQQVPSEIASAALATDAEQPQLTPVADAATSAGVAEAGVPAAARAADQPPTEDGAEVETGSACFLHAWNQVFRSELEYCCQFHLTM